MKSRYFVREPRNAFGELIGPNSETERHKMPMYSVKDSAVLIPMPGKSSPVHDQPKLIIGQLTYEEAQAVAAQLNEQDLRDQGFAINM